MRYIVRDRHGTYKFRRPIPEALRSLMAGEWGSKANWVCSLGTKDPAEAKRRYPAVLTKCNRDFQLAEMRKAETHRKELSADEIAALASWFRDVAIFEDQEFRVSDYREDEQLYLQNRARLLEMEVPVDPPWPLQLHLDSLSPRQIVKRTEGIVIVRVGLRKALATSDTSWIAPEVDLALEAFGVSIRFES